MGIIPMNFDDEAWENGSMVIFNVEKTQRFSLSKFIISGAPYEF